MNSSDLELVQRIKDNASYIDKSVKKVLDAGNKEWCYKPRHIYKAPILFFT